VEVDWRHFGYSHVRWQERKRIEKGEDGLHRSFILVHLGVGKAVETQDGKGVVGGGSGRGGAHLSSFGFALMGKDCKHKGVRKTILHGVKG